MNLCDMVMSFWNFFIFGFSVFCLTLGFLWQEESAKDEKKCSFCWDLLRSPFAWGVSAFCIAPVLYKTFNLLVTPETSTTSLGGSEVNKILFALIGLTFAALTGMAIKSTRDALKDLDEARKELRQTDLDEVKKNAKKTQGDLEQVEKNAESIQKDLEQVEKNAENIQRLTHINLKTTLYLQTFTAYQRAYDKRNRSTWREKSICLGEVLSLYEAKNKNELMNALGILASDSLSREEITSLGWEYIKEIPKIEYPKDAEISEAVRSLLESG
jgi:hypothetical protein